MKALAEILDLMRFHECFDPIPMLIHDPKYLKFQPRSHHPWPSLHYILNSSNFFQATLTSFVSIDNKFSGSTFSGSESELSLCAGRAEKWGTGCPKCSHEINMLSQCILDVSLWFEFWLPIVLENVSSSTWFLLCLFKSFMIGNNESVAWKVPSLISKEQSNLRAMNISHSRINNWIFTLLMEEMHHLGC